MGQVLPQSPAPHKSPFSPRPTAFTASPSQSPFPLLLYLKSGNPQELQAREAVRKEPPALAGFFLFFYEGLFISLPLCFQPSPVFLQWEFAGTKNWRKSSWNSPGEQKGFCAGGFGGRGCFHCPYLRVCFPHLAWQSRRWAQEGLGTHRHLPHLPAV